MENLMTHLDWFKVFPDDGVGRKINTCNENQTLASMRRTTTIRHKGSYPTQR